MCPAVMNPWQRWAKSLLALLRSSKQENGQGDDTILQQTKKKQSKCKLWEKDRMSLKSNVDTYASH